MKVSESSVSSQPVLYFNLTVQPVSCCTITVLWILLYIDIRMSLITKSLNRIHGFQLSASYRCQLSVEINVIGAKDIGKVLTTRIHV